MSEIIDLTVIKKEVLPLRIEFHEILPHLPKNWRKEAAKINPFFGTLEGFKVIQTVVNKRASLERTRLVLETAKQILLAPSPQPAQSPEPTAGGDLEGPTERQKLAAYRLNKQAERNDAGLRVKKFMARENIERP